MIQLQRARTSWLLAGSLLVAASACAKPDVAEPTAEKPAVEASAARDKAPTTRKPLALDASHEPLRGQFNADAEFARLVVLVSPT